jgi:tripartite-type tricarboxylate transporter receptor subunit TctC
MAFRTKLTTFPAACLAAALACAAPAWAQFGAQPAKIVFPFAAGGSGDAVSRFIAERLQSETGQSVVVDDHPGAGGIMGVMSVKTAPADGTTLLLTPFTLMSIFPHVYPDLKYDPVRDFAPVSQVATFEFSIVAAADTPAKTIRELVDLLKRDPSKGSFGSPGAGSLPHFLGVAFSRAAGIELRHVPYRGAASALTDVVAGQIPLAVLPTSDVIEYEKLGKIRVLATLGARKSLYLPNAPTLREAGYDVAGDGWFALYAPAGTPAAAIARINAIAGGLARSPEFRDRLSKLGLEATGTSPDELAALQKDELAKYGPLVKASGFKPTE